MLKFVPPKTDEKVPRYASYGNGQLKSHGTLSGARNSLNNRCNSWRSTGWKEGFILENVGGEWFVLYHVPKDAKIEDLPWMKQFYEDYSYGSYSSPYTDSMKESNYYQNKLKDGSAKLVWKPVAMTKDEYAEWRISVEYERLGLMTAASNIRVS